MSRPVTAALALLMSSFCGASTLPTKLEDPLANPGFVDFYNNDFDGAISYFTEQVKLHPEDPAEYNHLAQSVLYREMFRDGALETQLVSGNNPFLRRAKMEVTPQDKQLFDNCIGKTIELTQARLQQNPNDTMALYAFSVAHGLRANYLFLVEKAWLDALREASEARRTNERIVSIDPQFVDARLILGLDQYLVACLPFYMRAIGSFGGFHGDKSAGISQLELVSRTGILNRYDAEVLLAAIYRREHCPQRAIPLLEDLARSFPRNYLFRFEQVQMYSDAGNKEAALKVLAEIDSLRASSAPGYANLQEEKVRYLKGNLLFWYGDLDEALANLKQATKKTDELDLNTAVLAWLRLGQVYDLKGKHQEAIEAYRETMKTAPNSQIATEAKGYIASPYRRSRTAG